VTPAEPIADHLHLASISSFNSLQAGCSSWCLKPCLHHTTGCQNCCTTGLTSVLNKQPLFV